MRYKLVTYSKEFTEPQLFFFIVINIFFYFMYPYFEYCQEYITWSTNLQVGSRDSSVGIALGYGLDDRGSMVRFPAGAGNFSLHHRVQNGSGAHPASYPMSTRGSFSEGKADGAWSWLLTSI
jgi:hypothetical protein